MHDNTILISLIIATYNVENLIEKTLKSILNQSYQHFEIIIVDGASDDLTTCYIEKYSSQIAYYISEADNGIYDAWNKGLKQAKGQWIAFLGAGDEYLPGALKIYSDLIYKLSPNVEFISSQVAIVDGEGKCMCLRGKPWSWPQFLSSMTCAHVGALHSRKLFEKYGLFDSSYRIAGDYEFLMRAKSELQAAFIPMVTVHMLNGGISTSTKILSEDRKLKINTGDKPIWRANIEFIKNHLKKLVRNVFELLVNKQKI